VSVDLVPNGSSVPVTKANVTQYCDLHARHLLVHAIHKQFAAFQRGFLRLCSGAALQLFR
jgi:ubiquitin-protein ligase E3 A